MEKILETKNLRISFRTNNGTVKAVRGINFNLRKGETLAIVGESGSGKSVTARAIMGILAGNAIVESGEIFFDGRDLMKIPEDDFHQIRGNRISMIFQDPFSSLNPIMKVGQQLTEAMILNGKANQRDAGREFKKTTKLLSSYMTEALSKAGKGDAAAHTNEQMGILKKFTAKSNELEKSYNTALNWLDSLSSDIDGHLIEIIQGEPKVVAKSIKETVKNLPKTEHEYLVSPDMELEAKVAKLNSALDAYAAGGDKEALKAELATVRETLSAAAKKTRPDFFAMGYYALYCDKPDVSGTMEERNARMKEYMEKNFMDRFLDEDVAAAIKLSRSRADDKKPAVIAMLEAKLPLFENDEASRADCRAAARDMIKIVRDSIDGLEITKDSFAYTFESSINAALDTYLRLRHLRTRKLLSRKDRAFVESGDIDLYRSNVATIMIRIRDAYRDQLGAVETTDYRDLSEKLVAHIRRASSRMVYRVTKRVAKKRAIDLMEEVGIPDARKRYIQYPFQFSGGMRQRVVIAIALSANPDILICDEPTTALDVTIQAQILDLINGLKAERQLSVIFITHDLGVVANMADHIAVMYAGKIIEMGSVDEVFYEPAHPYTWALLASMPDLDTKEKLWAIPGTPPNMIYPPKGDAFAERNKFAMEIDFEAEPPMFEITPTHCASTWLLHPDAPKVEPPKIVTDRIKRMRNLEEVSGNE